MRKTWITLLLFAALVPAVPAWSQFMLAGDDRGAWAIQSDEPAGFRLAWHAVGDKWRTVGEHLSGVPVAAAAIGEDIHIFMQNGGYLIRSQAGEVVSQNLTNVVAACGSGAITGPRSELLAIVAMESPLVIGATTTSAPDMEEMPSSASSRPTATRVRPDSSWSGPSAALSVPASSGNIARPVRLDVMHLVAGQWARLTVMDDDIVLQDGAGVLAAAVDDTLYILVSTPVGKGPGAVNRLFTWRNRLWRELPLEGMDFASGGIIGMFAVRSRLAIVAQELSPQGDSRRISVTTRDAQRFWPAFVLTQQGQPATSPAGALSAATWPADAMPAATCFGDAVMLVGKHGNTLRQSLCDLNGQIAFTSDVDIFVQPAETGKGDDIVGYFMFGALVAVFVLLFFVRPRTPPKPFTLPPLVAPAPLGRRAMAALVDFLPFAMAARALIPFDVMPIEDFWEQARQQSLSVNFAYWFISTLTAYVAYGTLCEWRLGGTLGKRLFHLRVIADDGRAPNLREVALRNLIKILEFGWPPLFLFLVVTLLVNRTRQRLGDMLARTVVIDARTLPPGDGRPKPPEQKN